jgi:hypothetical protein
MVKARYGDQLAHDGLLLDADVLTFSSALLDGFTFAGIPGGSASIINALGVLHSPTRYHPDCTLRVSQ